MKPKIKFATLKDFKDIQDLNHRLCLKEYAEFDQTIDKDYSLSDPSEKYFKKRIRSGCALVAVLENKVIGYLVGGIVEAEEYRTISKLAEAENMFVLEKFRSLGIGGKLFKEFIKWCRLKKAKRVRVVASAQNFRAIRFYRREGFKDYDLVLERNI
ncbi:MAG: GNAT family N-acetyltransferase [Patescibacteria group bacterium]